jgi:squalene cyclase
LDIWKRCGLQEPRIWDRAPSGSRGCQEEEEKEENESAEMKRNVFLKSKMMKGPGWAPNAFSEQVG